MCKVSVGVQYVYITEPMVLLMCEAKVRAGVDTELTTDLFVGCNVIFIVFLFKYGVVWQSGYTLDSTHLVQYTPDRIVDVKQIKRTNLRGKTEITSGKEYVVAHHRAKFSCCGQKLMWGPPSHFFAYFEVVNLICVLLKISLNLVVKNSVGVT